MRGETNRIGQGRRTHESESRLLPGARRRRVRVDGDPASGFRRQAVSAATTPRSGRKGSTPGERRARGAAVASECCAVHFVDDTWERCRECRRPRRQHGWVPTISRFFGISIAMFFDDHGPPHFHARHAEGNAKIRIDSLEVIESNLPRRQLRFVLAWAELRQDELRENWRRARR